ncbi:tetratricopeptide repeat protein [Actinomadura latina]|uniref:Tetratricopeptide repeat protein n=1 Tax=Actinomadura latina TaxID=163603 RepID=A0A846YXV0_9ACTN|nr:tetratricopeptide repeat protein [Actinomadura latina]
MQFCGLYASRSLAAGSNCHHQPYIVSPDSDYECFLCRNGGPLMSWVNIATIVIAFSATGVAAWQAAKTFLLRRKTGNVDVSITSGDMRFNMSGNMDSEEVRRIVELLLARDQSTAVAREEGILTAFKGAKGEDHPDTLASASKLASAYQDAGRIQEAINLYESTLDSMRRVLGEDHADTLASASKLASAYRDMESRDN